MNGKEAFEEMKNNCFLRKDLIPIIEKELDRLERLDNLLDEMGLDEEDLPNWYQMQLDDGKKVRVLEIIKKYPRCSLQRVIAFIQDMNDGYTTLTEEHLRNRDIPYTIDEFNLIKGCISE